MNKKAGWTPKGVPGIDRSQRSCTKIHPEFSPKMYFSYMKHEEFCIYQSELIEKPLEKVTVGTLSKETSSSIRNYVASGASEWANIDYFRGPRQDEREWSDAAGEVLMQHHGSNNFGFKRKAVLDHRLAEVSEIHAWYRGRGER